MKIGVDIMGGDFAPQKTVQGAILALNEISYNTKLVLFGNQTEIIAELNANNFDAEKFEIVNCSEIIKMDENWNFLNQPKNKVHYHLYFSSNLIEYCL